MTIFNSNLGGFLRVSFWGAQGEGLKVTPCLKLVRIMLETWNLVRKYTYAVSDNIPFSIKTPLILLFFYKKSAFFGKNSIFSQSNSVGAVLEMF